ncbi:hypothetical protein PIB30_035228 [Stylosanthes scabra]|uniref:Uncharacterized protein n=1 Tax=Stylosanthes scabra TaxID=79078 RepID=A0ABU6TCS9_9FABA|nr:hypothetical protein [Stylosanthes scabra]
MDGEESVLALVHHDGIIKHGTKEGIRFIDKNPTNMFITTRTRLLDLHRSVLRKLGLDGRKRTVPEARTTELFVEIVDPLANSGGSAPNPQSVNVGGPSCYAVPHRTHIQLDPDVHQVASPYFGLILQREADDNVGDLGDDRAFRKLAVAMAGTPRPVSLEVVERVPDPLVKKAL